MNEITEKCPFCGANKDLLRVVSVRDHRNVELFVLRCGGCLADGPPGLSPEIAVDNWNKREQDTSQWAKAYSI